MNIINNLNMFRAARKHYDGTEWVYFRICMKHLASKLFGLNLQEETIYGHKIRFFNYGCFVGGFDQVFVRRVYDFALNRPTPVIYDCGANMGLVTLYFKLKYPKSRIFAYEADLPTFKLLKSNIGKIKGVKVYNLAVCGHNGDALFATDTNKRNTGTGRISDCGELVRTRKLPMCIKTDFLKLDIEGCELEALGAISLDYVDNIAIETTYEDGMNDIIRIFGDDFNWTASNDKGTYLIRAWRK